MQLEKQTAAKKEPSHHKCGTESNRKIPEMRITTKDTEGKIPNNTDERPQCDRSVGTASRHGTHPVCCILLGQRFEARLATLVLSPNRNSFVVSVLVLVECCLFGLC